MDLNKSLTRWKHQDAEVPSSVCSEPCPAGHVRKGKGVHCCWVCIQCREYEIITGDERCLACENGTFPTSSPARNVCEPLPVEYMSIDSVWAVPPVVFSVTGIVSVLFVVSVFVRYNNTPVIMASGRELCYVLMAGMLLCYAMTFVLVAKPTIVSCTLSRAGLGLSLTLCYAALFTKTNRISRIFNRGLKAMVKRPSYTSPRSQLAICFCLVGVQAIGAATWIVMDLPHPTYAYPDRRSVILRCKTTNVAIVVSLLYNMLLIALCTVYAFKTRNIPENFNEAKYIAFTMYSTCIVWLAFIPIYFGTDGKDFKVRYHTNTFSTHSLTYLIYSNSSCY